MVQVEVEYCGACDYSSQCKEMTQMIQELCPGAEVKCEKGRQGSFEVKINGEQVYSKRQTMAFPDYHSVAENVQNAELGKPFTRIKQQRIDNCTIT